MESATEVSKRATKLAAEGRLSDAIIALEAKLSDAVQSRDVQAIALLCGHLCVYGEQVNGPEDVIKWATIAMKCNPRSAKFAYALADAKSRTQSREDARALAMNALSLARENSDEDVLELLSSHPEFRQLVD